jgi:hypothetical protein
MSVSKRDHSMNALAIRLDKHFEHFAAVGAGGAMLL